LKRKQPASSAPASASNHTRRTPWSKAHQDLALIYRERGMKPDEIAGVLGISRYLVTQMLLAATNKGKP
jgi:DNA-binding transcriptional regulator LsrR (DeoR family)